MHEILECLCWLYFNCGMLSNPQWSFGWPPTLFVWMGRRRAILVAFLVSMLEASLGPNSSLCFGSLSLGLWLDVGLMSFIFHVSWDLITQHVEIGVLFWRCVMRYVAWLLWRFILYVVEMLWYYSAAMFWKIIYACLDL